MPAETNLSGEELIEELRKRFFPGEVSLIEQAYTFAQEHYAALRHPTGKPYLEYVLGIADLLANSDSLPLVIAASIVNPPLPEYDAVLEDLKRDFARQEDLVKLVEELFRLSKFEWDTWYPPLTTQEEKDRKEVLLKMFLVAIGDTESDEYEALTAPYFQKKEKQIENIVRMFLAEVNDTRALLIKLADRLHCMKLMKNLEEKEKAAFHAARLARISLAIYAPLADRLGLWQFKSELEDMSFRLLDMQKYKEIGRQLQATKLERENAVRDIVPKIATELAKYGIEAEITGRAKHLYSIYKKMEAKQLNLEEINDLLGIRIIVSQLQKCYDAQEIIHSVWPAVTSFYDGEVGRDWIAQPKENGYQSLHTTIMIDNKIVEVQIRTRQMHETAEFGAAAEHWRYKDPKIYRKGKVPRVSKAKDVNWGKQLVELRKNLNDQRAVAALMKRGFLKERVFVITPEGHVVDLPQGSSPLDFAYRIHTDLGHRYTGAKVNGHIVRLDYELKNGDIVELLSSRPRSGPNPDWLAMTKDEEGKRNYLFARTRQARSKINHWLREQRTKQSDLSKQKKHDVQKSNKMSHKG